MTAPKYAQQRDAGDAVRAVRELGPRESVRRAVAVTREVAPRAARRTAWRLQGYALRRRTPPEFEFAGRRHRYVWHPYNFTWRNERAVEIPVVWSAVEAARGGRVLEVGNVLSHYFDVRHDVVDKFERAPGVINEDLLDHRPAELYDLVVSISTIEHVGWDDHPRDPAKVGRALHHIRDLLAPGGGAVVAFPVGYNPHLDEMVAHGDPRLGRVRYLLRTGPRSWRESARGEALARRYGEPHPGANALVVAYLDAAS